LPWLSAWTVVMLTAARKAVVNRVLIFISYYELHSLGIGQSVCRRRPARD
jgi:hypothetical protein